MRTVEARPEEVLVYAEFRLSEMKKLRHAMNYCTVAMDLSNPDNKEAHECFTGGFYNWLNDTITALEDGS